MQLPFSDGGRPPSYTMSMAFEAEQQSSCVPELAGMEAYYPPSPVAQNQSPSSLEAPTPALYHHHQHDSFSVYNSGTFASLTSDPQYHQINFQAGASPPPGLDNSDNYSHHSSPNYGGSQTRYSASPVSPTMWPSPHRTSQQPTDPFALQTQQDSSTSLQIYTPAGTASPPNHVFRSFTSHNGNFSQSFEADVHGMPLDPPPSTVHDYRAEPSPGTASPVDTSLEGPAYMLIPSGNQILSGNQPRRLIRSSSREANGPSQHPRGDEPYAQLIYRALMSRPDYCMSLQDIYQWFRENTDKANGEGKGWQNSIRHNLSMNKAFLKLEEKLENDRLRVEEGETPSPFLFVNERPTPSPGSRSHGSKRSTEWTLEDWAIIDGVESTTRYRKDHQPRNGSEREGGATSHGSRHDYHHDSNQVPARTMSRRRGSCAAIRARLRRRYSQGPRMSSAMPVGPQPIWPPMHAAPSMYGPQYGSDHTVVPELETPPQVTVNPESGSLPSTPGMPTPGTSTPDSSSAMLPEPSLDPYAHGATYALVDDDQGSLHAGPLHGEFPYGASDVTGVYHGEYRSVAPPPDPPAAVGGDSGHHFGMIDNESYEWSANMSL